MQYVLLVLTLPALPAQAGGNEAEKLFRQMEKKIVNAKTVRVTVASQYIKDGEKTGEAMGILELGQGNKGRIDIKGQVMGVESSVKIIADGEKLKMTVDPPGGEKEPALPKNFGRLLRLGISRLGSTAGLLLFSHGGNNEDEDVAKRLLVSDFKLSKDVKIGGRAARVVEYRLTVEKEQVAAKLWLDAETHLPLKRELSREKGGETLRVVETYSEFKFGVQGGKAPDKAPESAK